MKLISAEQVIILKGAEVAFYAEHTGTDVSCFGTVTDRSPFDPDGTRYDDLVEVTWEDGTTDIMGLNQLMAVIR